MTAGVGDRDTVAIKHVNKHALEVVLLPERDPQREWDGVLLELASLLIADCCALVESEVAKAGLGGAKQDRDDGRGRGTWAVDVASTRRVEGDTRQEGRAIGQEVKRC